MSKFNKERRIQDKLEMEAVMNAAFKNQKRNRNDFEQDVEHQKKMA